MKYYLLSIACVLILAGAGCEPLSVETPARQVINTKTVNEMPENIGIASTLIDTRMRSRDIRRTADYKTIQSMLEQYYTDNNSYPVGTDVVLGRGNASCLNKSGFMPADCQNPYNPSRVPSDPSEGNDYVYSSTQDGYVIKVTFEGDNTGLSRTVNVTPYGIQ